MASNFNAGALDAPRSPSPSPYLKLRYQVHRATRKIFWKTKHGLNHYDQIDASAAYAAAYDGEHLTPKLVGYLTEGAGETTYDPSLGAIELALYHARWAIHNNLQREPDGFDVHIIIFCDNIKGLQLMRKAVESGSLDNLRTRSGRPKSYPAVLEEPFVAHQKIEHMVGRHRVKFQYKFPGGNTRTFFDQKIVIAKCKEMLDRMQEEYYASPRWNQVSLFLLSFDCHRWLEGYCDLGPECRYTHRKKKLGTGIPPRPQKDTANDENDDTPTRKVGCKYWAQGKCFNGDACTFAHEGDGGVLERPVCIYWKQGECFNGNDCDFRHGDVIPDAGPHCSEVDLCAGLEEVEIGGDSEGDGESP